MPTNLQPALSGNLPGVPAGPSTPTEGVGCRTAVELTVEKVAKIHEWIEDVLFEGADLVQTASQLQYQPQPQQEENTMSDETPDSPMTIAEQIKNLIANVDTKIAEARADFKEQTAVHTSRLKGLIAERKAITAAIQGVRRRVTKVAKKTKPATKPAA